METDQNNNLGVWVGIAFVKYPTSMNQRDKREFHTILKELDRSIDFAHNCGTQVVQVWFEESCAVIEWEKGGPNFYRGVSSISGEEIFRGFKKEKNGFFTFCGMLHSGKQFILRFKEPLD